MGIRFELIFLFLLFPILLFVKGKEWRQAVWYPFLWLPLAFFVTLPAVHAVCSPSHNPPGPGSTSPVMILFIIPTFLVWLLNVVALLTRWPQCWEWKFWKFPMAGGAAIAVILFVQQFARTEPIEIHLSDAKGKPWRRVEVDYSTVSLFGRLSKTRSATDMNGRLSIRIPRKKAVGLRIASESFKPMIESGRIRRFQDTRLYVSRNTGAYPDDWLSASWKIRGPGDYIHQSVKMHLPKGTPITRIPWIVGSEDQAFAIDYSKVWAETWPSGRLENHCWNRLVDFESVLAPFRKDPLPDSTSPLIDVAADLAKIEELRLWIGTNHAKPNNGDAQAVSDQIGRALCTGLLGADPVDRSERSQLLGDFVYERTDQLMELIQPWMADGNRGAYGAIGELGRLARPLTSQYPSVYPLLDGTNRMALRRTLWKVGPDIEDVLFLLDDPDERAAFDFFDALRSPARPPSLLKHDLAVFDQWVKNNPQKFTEPMKKSLENAIAERRK